MSIKQEFKLPYINYAIASPIWVTVVSGLRRGKENNGFELEVGLGGASWTKGLVGLRKYIRSQKTYEERSTCSSKLKKQGYRAVTRSVAALPS